MKNKPKNLRIDMEGTGCHWRFNRMLYELNYVKIKAKAIMCAIYKCAWISIKEHYKLHS